MLENKAASRYAKSIIDLATEQNALEQIKTDMAFIAQLIDQNPELEAILKNPIVPLAKKSAILQELFSGKVHEITITFLKLMVSKGRSEIIFGAAKSVVRQYNILKGIVTAEVASAIELTDSNRAEIVALVKKSLGANEVLIKEKINADLIGGFVLTVGDKQYNASISQGLNKLKQELAQGVA